ncbi:adenosylcobalamin-dependent ribonucleoside-diphosphate reductase [Candidatus Woesearchaeota archaeon]|nr:adenosylcobalamin-dependent ribonucleoside-diphosphate reductase [Candidatus Woesearchaeota archaeon]
MFLHRSKLLPLVSSSRIHAYHELLFMLKDMQQAEQAGFHPSNAYLGGNELADNIYRNKYYLKDLSGSHIEHRPEDVFARLAAFIAAMEKPELQREWALRFYSLLYNGYFLPGGRVIAGAGDLYRLKTLANCFVSVIPADNIESIYHTAYECARTYSYGGGIGVDISPLRPRDSVVHNAAYVSTGSVSFMEIYSLTTGLIGQAGRRGALMLTIDVKHPDVLHFINVKRTPNWVTRQIVEQCKWSGKFDEHHLRDIEKQVRENTQVRFANISLKVSDEFMQAVDEETTYGSETFLAYQRSQKEIVREAPQNDTLHYSSGIPAKDISQYTLLGAFPSIAEVNQRFNLALTSSDIDDTQQRDLFGDYVIGDIAIRRAGDFLLYFGSETTSSIKRLVKARDVWNAFVTSNYQTAEPGLIFWSTMKKYSPSNYLGKNISSTNPCGEVPLEDGGACNLGSINLSRFVVDGYTAHATIDWNHLRQVSMDIVRFLDNVISWNEALNPLEKQRRAAAETRRLGIGVMGIADMFNQLGMGYDSDEGIALLERVMQFIANAIYLSSSNLAAEKGHIPIWDAVAYAKNPFFSVLDPEVQQAVLKQGLRNVALLSIAPTGTISNVVLGFAHESKHYVGVSGGIEPIFALYYTRRSESFGNKLFKIFHPTVQAYIDLKGMQEQVQQAEELQQVLPSHFFRTAHFLSPEKRVEIQGIAQKYIDHSISSTVNLPESIDPETISHIYLQAWKKGLKGITIYRDGSRYPILSVAQEQSEFQELKQKEFRVFVQEREQVLLGSDVFALPDGKLTTVYHAMKMNLPDVIIEPLEKAVPAAAQEEENAESPKICTIKFENGQLVKSCGE